MEKEKTDLAIFKGKIKIEHNLKEEYLFIKQSKESFKNVSILFIFLFILIFLLIYSVGSLRRFVTWLDLKLLGIFEYHPNIFTFILLLIVITLFIFKLDKSIYSFLFGFIVTYLSNYVLHKIKILYILDYSIKYFAIFLKKIYYIPHIITSFFIAYITSSVIALIFQIKRIIKKIVKVYTGKDKEYIEKFLKANESLFILYSPISDPNNNFYMQELSNLSAMKKGKYVFIMIHYFTEIEKYLYFLIFNEKIDDQPKFGVMKGKEKKILMEQFPKKEIFTKKILNFVDKYESEEFKEEINKKNEEVEKEEEEEKDKEEKDKEEDKEKMMEENVE